MPRPRSRSLSGARQRPLSAALLAVVLSLFLAVSACAGDSEDDPGGSGSGDNGGGEESASAAAEEPYLPVPDGVELTAQGSQLQVGEAAAVAYEPRQDQVGVLRINVTRLIDADFKDFVGWKLTDETRKANPYFVHATVKNIGDTDLGGEGVPLYAVDGNNKLVEASTFQSTFKPCSPGTFPKRFENGDKGNFCLVYLAPDKGDLTAVSFRPVEDFDPITWTGNLQETGGGGRKGDNRGDRGDRNGGGGNGGGNGGGGNGGGGNGGGGDR